MKSEKQGLQFSKNADSANYYQDYFPMPNEPNVKCKEVCYALYEASDFTGYMDLTGRFPKISSSGNQYILIDYHYNANYVYAALIKNRRGNTIIEA